MKENRQFILTTGKDGLIDFYERLVNRFMGEWDLTREQAIKLAINGEVTWGSLSQDGIDILIEHFKV